MKFIVFFLFISTILIQKAFANDFLVTGHVYANPNEFRYILEQTKKLDIDTLYILGDMEDNVLDKIEYFENFYNINIHTVPGNHEITNTNKTNKYIEKYGSYRAFTNNNQLNILLNTMDSNNNKFSHHGYSIQGKQLKFLQNALAGKAENIQTINIFMHHALFLDGITIKEQEIISDNKLNKLNTDELKKYAKKRGYTSSYLSNHLISNSWHEEVYPLLKKELENGKKINVFSGDNSISVTFQNKKINYYLTGLRQYTKPPFIQDDMQSFLKCQSQGCKVVLFENFQPELISMDVLSMDDFVYELNLLKNKKPVFVSKISKGINVENLKKLSYIFLEKEGECSFPKSILSRHLEDKQKVSKLYSGFNTNQNSRLYLINRIKNDNNHISIEINDTQDSDRCNDFIIKIYNHDFDYLFKKFNVDFKNYFINVDKDDLKKIYSKLPTIAERQDSQNRYQFPSIKGSIYQDDETNPIKLKLRGGTWFHWKYTKKSHAIKYKNDKRPRKIFYIPEKRSIFGEYLIHKLSSFIGLETLNQSYGYLNINNQNNGLYFITNIYDKFFLENHKLPESNIYHTDSFAARLANFEIEKIEKNMFIGGLKQYQDRFDNDIDYFLKVIKSDESYLKANWEKHFDKNNLTKILSMLLLSGTQHYDLHNLYFYINPSNGKIYFFPWDFMNFSNAQKIYQSKDIENNIDFKNYNEILSKLLNIGEVRFLRNKFIYENAKEMKQFIQNFYNQELPFIMSKMILDESVPLSFDNGTRSMFSFMNIPKVMMDNIDFQLNRIKKNFTKLDFNIKKTGSKNIQLNFDLTSYSGIILEELILQKKDGNHEKISLNKKKLFSGIAYDQKFGAPIKIISTNHKLNISVDDLEDVTNVELIYSNFFAPTDKKIIYSAIDDFEVIIKNTKKTNFNKYKHLFNVDGNNLTFKNLDVTIKENIILPESLTLKIKPGTIIRMKEKVSLITYGSIIAAGTKKLPIKFIPLNNDLPWGVVGMVGDKSKNIFKNCFFSGGSGAYSNGKYFSGMLSAYYVKNVIISECEFTNSYNHNGGDDAVNIKNTTVNIYNSSFFSNEGDAIDVDYVEDGSSILNSKFISNKNDGIDVSYSQLQISGNQIEYNRDKGISIGEDSKVTITNTKLLKNKLGIAIKDGSDVLVEKSNILKNIVGIGLYNKKRYFTPPRATLISTEIEKNYVNCGIESTNRFGNKQPSIFSDNEVEKKGNKYRYILKSNIKDMSKKSIIKEALGSSWKNTSIEYILFNECNI